LLTKEITTAEHSFTVLSVSTSSFLNIFCKVYQKGEK